MNDKTCHPISNVLWFEPKEFTPNDYNPNVVMEPELVLLERSIITLGWVQPILISKADRVIIDGFHRNQLAASSAAIRKKWGPLAPYVLLDLTRAEAMLLTIRMNRAKGEHVATRMSSIIQELVNVHNYDPSHIASEIGAHIDEVELLLNADLWKDRDLSKYRYSKAWKPVEKK